jgi:hypothetical protein
MHLIQEQRRARHKSKEKSKKRNNKLIQKLTNYKKQRYGNQELVFEKKKSR